MNRMINIQLLLTIVLMGCLCAQDNSLGGRFEFQGSALYSYSRKTFSYPGEPFELYYKTSTFTLEPSAGYFLSDRWELILSPRVSVQSQSNNYAGYAFVGSVFQPREEYATYNDYELGVLVGVIYHIPLSETVISFLGTSAGWTWTKNSAEYSDPGHESRSSPWYGAKESIPNVVLGLKIFIRNDWCLIPQAQFMKILHSGYDSDMTLSLGIGFAIYTGGKDGN